MTSLWNGMRGAGQLNREDFITRSMYMKERLGYRLIIPFQYGIYRPFYKAIVAIVDYFSQEFAIGGGLYRESMFDIGCHL